MKSMILSFLSMSLLVGCASLSTSTPRSAPQPPAATSTIVLHSPAASVQVTSTDWLPYNPNYSAQGCEEYTATLPIDGMENLSQLEVSRGLFEIYLGHFRFPDLGGLCRLEDFKVLGVQERFANLASEQNVDFVSTVQYSVQVAGAPTQWAAGNGELASDGWIVRKALIIGVIKGPDAYVLKPIGTGP